MLKDWKLRHKFKYNPRDKDGPRSKGIAWLPSGTQIVSLERNSVGESSIACMVRLHVQHANLCLTPYSLQDVDTDDRTQTSITGVKVCSIGVVNKSCIIAVGTCLPSNRAQPKSGEPAATQPEFDPEKIMLCMYLIFR